MAEIYNSEAKLPEPGASHRVPSRTGQPDRGLLNQSEKAAFGLLDVLAR